MKYKGSKLLWVVYGMVEAKHDIFYDFFELFITTNAKSYFFFNCLLYGTCGKCNAFVEFLKKNLLNDKGKNLNFLSC
jgi:hypothetical protein